MRFVIPLSAVNPEDIRLVGGKAASLAALRQAGLTVPEGFVVTVAAYQHALASAGLDEVDPQQLQKAIPKIPLSQDLQRAILRAYRALASDDEPEPDVAVRSSATTEDLAYASFAGQQDTILNVRGERRLLEAIQACWASLWSPRAIEYRRAWADGSQPAMAVLVQRMVPAEAAGVVFSVDPVSGEEVIVIEAVRGSGEALLAGAVEGDRYAFDKTSSQEISAEYRTQRVLDPTQVRTLAQTVQALEANWGHAVDVEWAMAGGEFYFLQARPITTQAGDFFTDVIPGDNYVWTAGFLNERFPAPVSPLGWSVIREVLEPLAFCDPLHYLGTSLPKDFPITKLYRGHPYVNAQIYWTLYKVFPAFLLPEDAYRFFPGGDTSLRRTVAYPRGLFDPSFLVSMFLHFIHEPQIWSPWHNYRVWQEFTAEHEAEIRAIRAQVVQMRQELPETAAIWALVERVQRLNRRLLSLHRWSLIHAELTYTLLQRLLAAWVGTEQGRAWTALLAAGQSNKSVETDQALWELAAQAAHSSKNVEALASDPAFTAFLEHFGHRSFSLDIYRPTFAEQPHQVLCLITEMQMTGKPLSSQRASEAAYRSCRNALRSLPGGRFRVWLFDHLLSLVRRYMCLREDQRFYWQRALAIMRALFLLLGECMRASGALKAPDDIFFLSKDEVRQWVEGDIQQSHVALVAERKSRFETLNREYEIAPDRAYPAFLRGNRPLYERLEATHEEWIGRAVSPGVARGRAVVVLQPGQFDKVSPGDILVTISPDPGWTPIFGLLGGLVMERGGQLSHGAVVAREYGLPAVAGVAGATTALHDGDEVLVDGLAGVVRRLRNSTE
ncbi:MAG: hypothetical protein H5T64_00775 [Chloroflexi bacterium]|nr:hypothetical protein [Chloroflexota bacterium]